MENLLRGIFETVVTGKWGVTVFAVEIQIGTFVADWFVARTELRSTHR